MGKQKKKSTKEETLPNFTGHPYSDTIQDFAECDRILESDLNSLECYDKFHLERGLNSLNDMELNDHLYGIYYAKWVDSTMVLRRWIIFFVKQYPRQIAKRVGNYLE